MPASAFVTSLPFQTSANPQLPDSLALLLQASLAQLSDAVMIVRVDTTADHDEEIIYVNDAFELHTGYVRAEVLGKSPRMLQGKHTERSELERIRSAITERKAVRSELVNYRKNGSGFWVEVDIIPVNGLKMEGAYWVCVARNITSRKIAEDEIEYMAFHDALTQLPNRQLLMERLGRALVKSDEIGTAGALMFIDLDNFKVLNDTLGHATGDLLLQKVAIRIGSCVPLRDTVARLGGDEFVVMLGNLSLEPTAATAHAKEVGEKILAALSEPYDLAGYQHYSTGSIGITLFGWQQRQSVGDLLRQADLAMYQAKAMGRNALCFFDPETQAIATANANLNLELRHSLYKQEFVLHYQPQVASDGRMMGVEALVRWQHPKRGLVYPNEFISQAEESGLILTLGKWVLETACKQLDQWTQQPANAHLSISVNVSMRQFGHPEFVELVLGIIQDTGIDASRLKLELTESLLATGLEVTIAKMGRLKRAGVTLSIDDFGIGYSALSHLKYLPLDQLKIDRCFVKDILTDPNDAAIARTIIGLAQSLGLGVIAEGVENEDQRSLLARFGCESYQGYLFCKALPIDALEVFMQGLQRSEDE